MFQIWSKVRKTDGKWLEESRLHLVEKED